jgi:hypothetical protein
VVAIMLQVKEGPAVAARASRFRDPEALERQVLALRQRNSPTGRGPAEFDRGASAALSWLLTGGVAPLTGVDSGQSTPVAAAVVHELAAAEGLIYQRRSPQRELARGVQHALMWAQYATATPPAPPPLSAGLPRSRLTITSRELE